MTRFLWAVLLAPALALAQGRGVAQSPAGPKALHNVGEAPFDTQGFQLFSGGFRCDAAGNVFFAPLNPGPGSYPTAIVRVSEKGTTRYSLAQALNAEESEIIVNAFTLDPRGTPYVLVSARSNGHGRQVVVSFGDDGQVASQVEIDTNEIIASEFAVFASGDFLLLGVRQRRSETRVAIMPAAGGPLRDVSRPTASTDSEWLSMDRSNFVEPGPDGKVYFAPQAGPVYSITATGDVSRSFHIKSPQEGATLFDLKLANGRIAAIYSGLKKDSAPSTASSSRWIVVHDLDTGRETGTYGPIQRGVLCYRPDGTLDRFTLLGAKEGRPMAFSAVPH